MKTIKQTDHHSCVACVAAMVTNTTVDEFLRTIGQHNLKSEKDQSGFYDSELQYYLLLFGKQLGEVFYRLKGEVLFTSGNLLLEINKLYTNFNQPAYLVVDAVLPKGGTHAVYWDGKFIRDPNPLVPDRRKWEDYDYSVIRYSPIYDVRLCPFMLSYEKEDS